MILAMMMKKDSLPERIRERVLEHIRDYIQDVGDEAKWSESFLGNLKQAYGRRDEHQSMSFHPRISG
jgi:hypothetical protein